MQTLNGTPFCRTLHLQFLHTIPKQTRSPFANIYTTKDKFTVTSLKLVKETQGDSNLSVLSLFTNHQSKSRNPQHYQISVLKKDEDGERHVNSKSGLMNL